MVWLVLGGPAAVVVASFVTLWLAVWHPDPVVLDAPSPSTAVHSGSMTPAIQARNHAVTAP